MTTCGRAAWQTVTIGALLGLAPLAPTAAASHGGDAGGSQQYNVQLSTDSGDDRDSQLGAIWRPLDSTSIDALMEETTSPAGRADLVSHTYDLGVDQDLGDHVGFGLKYEWWGKKGDIDSTAWYGSFDLRNSSWDLAVLPGRRDITLYTKSGKVTTALHLPDTIDIVDKPIGGRLDFTGWQDWLLEISTTRHDYDRHVGFLLRRLGLQSLSGSALTLSQGFLSHESSARVERDFDLTSVAVDYERDQSAVNGSYSYTTDLDFQTPLSVAFDVELTVGVTHTLSLPQTRFITLNLIYYR